MLFISHNLGVISKMCDRVGVLYAGRLVEEGPVETVLQDPRHPVHRRASCAAFRAAACARITDGSTRSRVSCPSLGASIPGCVFADRCALADDRCHAEEPPLDRGRPRVTARVAFTTDRAREPAARGGRRPRAAGDRPRRDPARSRSTTWAKVFQQQGHDIHALVGVSASIWPGETLGLVGESGSGKTTLARTLLGIVAPTTGTVELDGRTLPPKYQKRSPDDLRALQIVFQNPDSALNRRHSVGRILLRSMKKLAGVGGAEAEQRVSRSSPTASGSPSAR